jgi:hypothetical protein
MSHFVLGLAIGLVFGIVTGGILTHLYADNLVNQFRAEIQSLEARLRPR